MDGEPWQDPDRVFEVVVAILTRGPVLGSRASVGAWTPAVSDAWDWAVLDYRGAPLFLARDAYSAARYYLLREEGPLPDREVEAEMTYPLRQSSDAYLADLRRWDEWFYTYRFLPWGLDDEPPYPRELDYP
jgi:hypothetical protein